MDKLYVLMYTDVAIADFRIFNNFNDAFIEYLKFSITETQKLFHEDLNEDEEDQFDDITCSFQIYELEKSEFKTIKKFDIDFFQDILNSKEDLEVYLNSLENLVKKGEIPSDIMELYQ